MVYPRLLYPVTLTASNNVLRVEHNDGGWNTHTVTLTAGTYYVSGDASVVAGQADLLKELELHLEAECGDDWSCSVSEAGTISIKCVDHAFSLLLSDALTTIEDVLGYDDAVSISAAANEWIAANYQHQYGWYPERSVRFSTGTGPERVVAVGESVSAKVALGEVSSATSRVEQIGPLIPQKIRTNDPATGVPWVDGGGVPTYLNESFEAFWTTLGNCADFRWYQDASVQTNIVGGVDLAYSRMCIKDANFLGRLVDKSVMGGAGGGAARLMYESRELYLVTLPMQHYVA